MVQSRGYLPLPDWERLPTLFFLGFDDSEDSALWHQVCNSQHAVNNMKPGQFLYELQCDGTACTMRYLRGVFFPLESCKETSIRDSLSRVASTFSGYRGDFPIATLKVAKSAIEAYLPFADPEVVFEWLVANGFSYISGVDRPARPDFQQIGVLADSERPAIGTAAAPTLSGDSIKLLTAPIAWRSWGELKDWLSEGGLQSGRTSLTAAMLYHNSD